jgi:hypothetical protein
MLLLYFIMAYGCKATNLSENRKKAPAPPCGENILILSENFINGHTETTPGIKKARYSLGSRLPGRV